MPEGLLEAEIVEVDDWRLRGPFPDVVGDRPIADPSAWEAILLEAARRKAGLVVASEAMRCAARELVYFQLEHAAYPTEDLRRFVFGRCGTSVAAPTAAHIEGSVDASSPEAAVVELWREAAETLVRDTLGSGPRAAGVAYAAENGRAVLVAVSGERRVHVEPFSPVPAADGTIRIDGELLGRETEISGLVNRGLYGFGRCRLEEPHALPRFRLTCEPERSDAYSWLSLAARASGRLLSEPVFDTLVRPSGAVLDRFERSSTIRPREVTSRAEFSSALAVELNRIRARGGLAPLTLDASESAVAERLVAPFFASHLGELDPVVADTVALGVMAGWDVEGVVREAHFGAKLVLQTRDLSRWLTSALAQPLVRSALLDPDVSRLALGSVVPEQQAYLAAIVATYALFHPRDYGPDREALHRRLGEAFAERERAAPRVAGEVEAFAVDMASLVRSGQVGPDEALTRILDYANAILDAKVWAWSFEVASLEDVTFPDTLFQTEVSRVALAIDHYRPADGAWGRYVVFLVAAADSPTRSASQPSDRDRSS